MPIKKLPSVGQVPQKDIPLDDPREEQFCQLYSHHFNATRAYKAAFDAKGLQSNSIWTSAWRLLRKAEVGARVEYLQKTAVKRMHISRDRIVAELSTMAFGKPKGKLSEYGKLRSLELIAQITGVNKDDGEAGSGDIETRREHERAELRKALRRKTR